MIPYEVWKGYKPNVNHLGIFGCSAYAHIPKDERSKMDPKAKKSIFLGYGIGVKGYRLFDTDTSKVFHSRDVIFNETTSISEQGTEEVENQPLVEVECKTSAVMMMRIHKRPQNPEDHQGLEKLQISMVNGYTLLTGWMTHSQ